MSKTIINKSDRRKFFSLVGKGTLGAFILSSMPFKMFSKSSNYHKLRNIEINKEAVKRKIN